MVTLEHVRSRTQSLQQSLLMRLLSRDANDGLHGPPGARWVHDRVHTADDARLL